jgi:signal recognition particle subunit SEC65
LSVSSGRRIPKTIAIIIPPAINELVAVPKLELKSIGIVSSSILGPATEKVPQAKPKINLPIQIVVRSKNIVNAVPTAATILKTIIHNLLPLVINLPPKSEPVTTPKIAELLIIVLYRTASFLLQPNLVLITGAV